MKKLYFIQAATTYKNKYSVYLPYSVGCLIAYAMQNDAVKNEYCVEEIFFEREKPEIVCDNITEPFLIAFSTALWNIEYSKKTAKLIKERYPNCHIVFGGHCVSDNTELLENEYVDFLIHNEGEEAFEKLLLALDNKYDLANVPNLSYKTDMGFITNSITTVTDLTLCPSPYTTGVFDHILKENPNVPFNAILETNRGCPYGCAYCEWCYTKKLRMFPMEKVKGELEWIASNKIEYCYCADANFGIDKRDVEIAKFAVDMKKEYGYPFVFRPTYANGGGDTVIEIGEILNNGKIDKGVTVAYQSLNPDVLKLIGRKNFGPKKNQETTQRLHSLGIQTYCELILGLPGETYDSFCNGLCRLLELSHHGSISVYNCQVYPNSLLGQADYQKSHGVKCARVPIEGIHYAADYNGVEEYFHIVVETNTMPFEHWVRANMFSTVLLTFHSNGLLRFVATYLYNEKNVSYYDFYNELLSFIMNADDTELHKMFMTFYNRYNITDDGDWVYHSDELGDIGWYYDEAAFLKLSQKLDVMYEELNPFLSNYFDDETFYNELIKFQKSAIRQLGNNSSESTYNYDFYSYFIDKKPLSKGLYRLKINIPDPIETLWDFAKKIILFGKRRGETLVINDPAKFEWLNLN